MKAKRATAKTTFARGRRRSIHPDRARDEDLHVFLKVGRQSRRAIRWYVDRLLGPVRSPLRMTNGRTRVRPLSFQSVLTEPGYSAASRHQIILPIYMDTSAPTESHDLLISAREWFTAFPASVSRVVLPIPATHSVWHAYGIARETEHVLDEDTLAEIDRRLGGYVSLPE